MVFSGRRRVRAIRAEGLASAEEALAGVNLKGCEIFGFTLGQFSLIELLAALLAKTGPADVSLSTWTAHNADLRQAYDFVESGKIRRFRLLVDRSFESRAGHYCESVRDLFGPESVMVGRVHAKFAVLRNERFDLAVRTSMNLNRNMRWEQFEVSDDARLCDFLDGALDALWAERPVVGCTNAEAESATRKPFNL